MKMMVLILNAFKFVCIPAIPVQNLEFVKLVQLKQTGYWIQVVLVKMAIMIINRNVHVKKILKKFINNLFINNIKLNKNYY